MLAGSLPETGRAHRAQADCLSILIGSYNAGYRLRQCIDAILEHPPPIDFEIIVVDDGSTDGCVDFLRSTGRPEVTFVQNPRPVGYAGCVNRGFMEARGSLILLLNQDMKVINGTINNMIRHLSEDEGLGGVVGYFIRPDGTFHRYYRRFPLILSCWLSFFLPQKLSLCVPAYRRHMMLDVTFSEPVEVQQPSASCLMVRRELWKEDFMNPIFCMFFSDVDISRKIYMAGRRIVVFPDCIVIHDHDHSNRSRDGISYLYTLDLYIGCANYFRIYHGFAHFVAVKLLFGSSLLLSAILSLVKCVLGKRSLKQVQDKYRLLFYFVLHRNILLNCLEHESGVYWH